MDVIASLKEERDRLERELAKVNAAIQILDGNQVHARSGASQPRTSGGHISAAGRRRLSELMKKRWAERRRAKLTGKGVSAR